MDRDILAALLDEGFAPDEVEAAARAERLALLPIERVLASGGTRYTRAELAARAGLPDEQLVELTRQLGLSQRPRDEPSFGEDDLAAASAVARFRDAGIDDATLARVTAVIGDGTSRLAHTIRELVGEALMRPGDDAHSLGARYAQAAEQLVPQLTAVLGYALRAHLRAQLKDDVLGADEIAAARFQSARPLYVCFADLVGFTRLGECVPLEELRSAGRHLNALAIEAAAAPVRLVKMLGDGAMLVSPEPEPLVAAALELVARVAEPAASMPPLRAGIAYGEAVPHNGDWFGAPVNLASRVTQIARPSSVLVTAAAREQLGERFAWSWVGRRRLRGVRAPVALYRARYPTSSSLRTASRSSRSSPTVLSIRSREKSPTSKPCSIS